MKAVKVKDIKLNLDYGWVVKIQDYNDLLNIKDFLAEALSNMVANKHSIEFLSDIYGSVLKGIIALSFDSIKALADALDNYGAVYINRNGGFFPKTKNIIEYSETIEIDKFPEIICKIERWPNGKHYYVVCQGKKKVTKKFNSIKEAEEFKKEIEDGINKMNQELFDKYSV